MKLVAILWEAYIPILKSAALNSGIKMIAYSNSNLDESPDKYESVIAECDDADIILLHKSHHNFWNTLDPELEKVSKLKPLISVGRDASFWALTSVEHELATTVYRYLINNGEENCYQLMQFLLYHFGDGKDISLPPIEIPLQGIVHPDAEERIFLTTDDYLKWYKPDSIKPVIGILLSRTAWLTREKKIEITVIRDLEKEGFAVIPLMTNAFRNEDTGSLNIADAVDLFFIQDGIVRIEALIKLVSFNIGKKSPELNKKDLVPETNILQSLGVPAFNPIITTYLSLDDWKGSNGLSMDIARSIALPEFEGMIEPLMLGSTHAAGNEDYSRDVVLERSKKLAKRVWNWVQLRKKRNAEKKVVFFLNNSPCAGVEANIGAASNLDTGDSVVAILKEMKKAGYKVNPPESGQELMQMFMDKKAVSEFRWTTITEIIKCGGCIHQMSMDEYIPYYRSLPSGVQDKMEKTWGTPPGLGMVNDDSIVITGISFGNAIVAVQPKRGCYGTRCDGEVCKILHDPDCPPTHQYVATYYYYSQIFGADAFIHVGTHGTLEFLPGKGTALSQECYPDITIGNIPNIYIYNTDNPSEGTTAKRRSYATLIGHMQAVMASGNLYEDYIKLDELLGQYETARHDPARCHALNHMIVDAVKAANLNELEITPDTPPDEAVRMCHEALSRIQNTQINLGMHTFGKLPEGDKRVEMINSILRYNSGSGTPRHDIAEIYQLDVDDLVEHQGSFNYNFGKSNGALLVWLEERVKDLIKLTLEGHDVSEVIDAFGFKDVSDEQHERLVSDMERILDLDCRISESLEIESFLNACGGAYISPGPSGIVTHGRDDVLPSGRNFYSLDPHRIPTTSAWRIGSRLADLLIDKYLSDTNSHPENVAIVWAAGDIISGDGEIMAEIFALLGVQPIWEPNGKVHEFRIIPAEELEHPRIDVTIRISGILRDNFGNCVDLVDSAIQAVAFLDEPDEINYVRKHYLNAKDLGISDSEATARIFSAKPGTYTSGVNLAVLASAWKDEKDLAEIYITTNGYAYGNGRDGQAAHEQFAVNLSTVSVTFNKVLSDERDLLSCCCYFGTHGGMTAASRHLSGKEVKTYYGDTRQSDHVEVRTLADELRRVVRTRLLNPRWIEGMKEHGYKGASTIMKRVTKVYGWEASTQEVDDWIFDDIAETFVNDPDMRQFFEENNPYALEEISRRLLEANSRGLWEPDPEILDKLRNSYMEIESWLEEMAGEGEYQGGNVDIITASEVDGWNHEISSVMKSVHKRMSK